MRPKILWATFPPRGTCFLYKRVYFLDDDDGGVAHNFTYLSHNKIILNMKFDSP